MLLIEKDKRYAYKKLPKEVRFAVDTILILLRGNSGSGKTTVAKALHQQLGAEAVLISQDVFRREIFHVKDTANNPAVGLMVEALLYAQGKVSFIIVEGIFAREKYHDFLLFLLESFEKCLIYYFDIPFQTTLERHRSRSQRAFFSEASLQKWWLEKDLLFGENGIASNNNDLCKESVLAKEQLITETQTISEIVAMILGDLKQFQE
jgi:adenylate kinase family enzyme